MAGTTTAAKRDRMQLEASRTVGPHDLPAEVACMIASYLLDQRDFDACLDAPMFCVCEASMRARRRGLSLARIDIIKAGDLDALRSVYKRRRWRFAYQDIEHAIDSDNLALVKWLWKRAEWGRTDDLLEAAAAQGNLDIVKWLHTVLAPSIKEIDRAIRLAALRRRFVVAEWLCGHCHGHPIKGRMHLLYAAVKCGDMALVQRLHDANPHESHFLYEQSTQDVHLVARTCDPYHVNHALSRHHGHYGLVDMAARKGNWPMFEYLWTNSIGIYTYRILLCALRGANVRIIEHIWLYQEETRSRIYPWVYMFNLPHHPGDLGGDIESGPQPRPHPYQAQFKDVTPEAMSVAAVLTGSLSVLILVNDLFGGAYGASTLCAAIRHKHWTLASYLLCKVHARDATKDIAMAAFESGSVVLVVDLAVKYGLAYGPSHVTAAVKLGHCAVVEWALCTMPSITITESMMTEAAASGNIAMVDLLFRMGAHRGISTLLTRSAEERVLAASVSSMFGRMWDPWYSAVTPDPRTMRYAIEHANLDTVVFLCETRHLPITPDMLAITFDDHRAGIIRYVAERVTGAPHVNVDSLFSRTFARGWFGAARALVPKLACVLERPELAEALGEAHGAALPYDPVWQKHGTTLGQLWNRRTGAPPLTIDRLAVSLEVPKRGALSVLLDMCALVGGPDEISWQRSPLDTSAIEQGQRKVVDWLHGRGLLNPSDGRLASAVMHALRSDKRRIAEWVCQQRLPIPVDEYSVCTNAACDYVATFI